MDSATTDTSVAGRRTPPPAPVGPPGWRFPHLHPFDDAPGGSFRGTNADCDQAKDVHDDPGHQDDPGHHDEADDLVAIGADLEPSTLVAAYRLGIFPWPHGWGPLPWFSPDPRGVLPLERLSVAKTLRQTLRRRGWHSSVDTAFDAVIDACATRPRREGTWINAKMKRAYRELHRLGHAHSIEVWDGDQLVGGLYGVLVGGVFTGESMFHRATDASKVALVELVHRLAEAGGSMVDVQLVTPHLASLGAMSLRRPLFLELLHELRDDDVRLMTDRLPVSRLAGQAVALRSSAPPRRAHH